MNEAKQLLLTLVSMMTPTTSKRNRAEEVICTAKVNPKTGVRYTYADVTSQVASGTICTSKEGGKEWQFLATPSGTPYTRKDGSSDKFRNDSFKLVHFITIDESQVGAILG